MLNTHDMPTFQAHWQGQDISNRTSLGLVSQKEARRAKAARAAKNAALVKFLLRRGLLAVQPAETSTERCSGTEQRRKYSRARPTTGSNAGAVARALLAWMASSDAEALLINLEDLWGEARPQNLPGMVNRLNWRRKARMSLEEIVASPALSDLLSEIDRLRRDATRSKKTLRLRPPQTPRA